MRPRPTAVRRAGPTAGPAPGKRPALVRLPGVYPPQFDSFLLARTLAREAIDADTRVLDVCAGTGVLSVSAGLAGAGAVTAVDVDRRALLNTRVNAALNRVRVEAVHGDLTAPLRGRAFDVVVSNPPYVPAVDDRLPVRGLSRCWDAGLDGRAVLDRICRDAPAILAPGGVLLLVQSALSGVDASRVLLEEWAADVDVVASARIPFGPVLRGRAPMLHDRGLIDRGQQHEDIVVLRAVA